MSVQRKVEIKDYNREIHLFLVALGMVGIHMNYQTADLILLLQKELKVNPEFSIDDATKMQVGWEKYWDKHFELKDKYDEK